MPRKPRSTAPAAPAETRPFAADSTAPFASLAQDAQRKIIESIAADKSAGVSGDEMRATYGERLTGPARRKHLREFGLANGRTISRSYVSYKDGAPRIGSRHAREHGSQAGMRIREHAAAQVADLSVAQCRKLLRDASVPVPSVRKGDETALRSAATDVLVLATVQGAQAA